MQITEQAVNSNTAERLGLTVPEYEKIKAILGRTPNFIELSVYSVMWSEHCCYKNSIKWLRTLPREGKQLLVGLGEENAGLVDIGDGIACAFKMKSNNRTSALEPYQGAATAVGSVHRHIFTLGARPIAALNSLRFGNPASNHMKRSIKGVVRGIGDYGNSLGVPTVAGEVFFDDCFHENILVNAMSVGIVRVGETVSASTGEPGNPVYIVGSQTGKDGTQVATFASNGLSKESQEDLPSIQIGDPFQEKLLLEASLEAIKSGAIVGMQAMGAAGIPFATAKMSAKSGTGMWIDLGKVPTRQTDMEAWEILLSESHERLLIVGKKGEEQLLLNVFEKWDLECVQIGEVTDTGQLEYYRHGEKLAEIPAKSLVLGGGAPVYERDFRKPAYFGEVQKFRLSKIELPKNYKSVAKKLFALPNLVSKRWVYEQYDSTVRTNNMSNNAPADAAVLRIKGSKKSLVVTVDCNPAYVHADPFVGTMIAVSEAARNITCAGGIPIAVANCLNFGDPYHPEVYYQFVQAIKGMAEACRKFNTPVTASNVSFYNQSKAGPIWPTPTIGMLGLMEEAAHQTPISFREEGDAIYLLGNSQNDLSSSEYLRNVVGVAHSPAPHFEMHEEFEVQQLVRQLIRKKWLHSAHDVSDGGLFTNLLESAVASGWGFNIETVDTFRKDCFLFGESQSRVVVTIAPEKDDEIQNFLINHNVSFTKLGEVFGTDVVIDDENFGSVAEWKSIYDHTLGEKLEK